MTTPARITRYTLGPEHDPVNIELAGQISGRGKWAIRWRSSCLSHAGEWHYEPLPSSRTEEFLAAHRWDNVEDAIDKATMALYRMEK